MTNLHLVSEHQPLLYVCSSCLGFLNHYKMFYFPFSFLLFKLHTHRNPSHLLFLRDMQWRIITLFCFKSLFVKPHIKLTVPCLSISHNMLLSCFLMKNLNEQQAFMTLWTVVLSAPFKVVCR